MDKPKVLVYNERQYDARIFLEPKYDFSNPVYTSKHSHKQTNKRRKKK